MIGPGKQVLVRLSAYAITCYRNVLPRKHAQGCPWPARHAKANKRDDDGENATGNGRPRREAGLRGDGWDGREPSNATSLEVKESKHASEDATRALRILREGF